MPEPFLYPQGRLVVFARQPVAGRVKTRLALGIGEQAACMAYQHLLTGTLETAVGSRLCPVELWLDATPEPDWLAETLARYPLCVRLQSGRGLGERMAHAFSETLQQTKFCILIGTDCPVLDTGYLQGACDALSAGTDIVIGPAEDGGYVLIGLRDHRPALFASIPWSTGQVMQATRRVISQRRWRHQELPELWDVDHPADWTRWTGHS